MGAGGILAVGFAWVWLIGGPFEGGPEAYCGDPLPEGAGYRVEPAAWPPGASRCVVEGPDEVRTHIYVPWLEWLTIALLAGAVGLAIAASTRVRGQALLALGALGLVVAAGAAYFAGALLGVGVALLVVAAVAMGLRAGPHARSA